MYIASLDGVRLPVAPGAISFKVKNRNRGFELINGEEINILKPQGLREISFEAELPYTIRPYAGYPDGKKFMPQSYYLGELERLKNAKKPFLFVVARENPAGGSLGDTRLTVSLEEYSILENASEGLDVIVSVNLKEYKAYGVKRYQSASVVPEAAARPADSAPNPLTYTVKSGDCLWNISKKYLGKGERWKEIYALNKDKIKNPDLIYPGQVLIMPVGG